jgi:hypothetical protein
MANEENDKALATRGKGRANFWATQSSYGQRAVPRQSPRRQDAYRREGTYGRRM